MLGVRESMRRTHRVVGPPHRPGRPDHRPDRHHVRAADPRQLRAPRRGGRRAGPGARHQDPATAGPHDHPSVPRHRRGARLSAPSAGARRRRGPVRGAGVGGATGRAPGRCEVRSLVARLDGLPLAVELAAAKVRAMSVSEIERRLENRFALLRGGAREAPERHQTLLAVIDWSWNLLDDRERTALRRLSIFRDGFSLAGADAVVDERCARCGLQPGGPVARDRARGRG